MRTMTTQLGGKELTLTADFKASADLMNDVADPMYIMREALLEVMMIDKGVPYQPRWMFTVENIPKMMHIALKRAHPEMKLSEIQDLVFEQGFTESRAIIGNWLQLIVGPKPETKLSGEGDSEGN